MSAEHVERIKKLLRLGQSPNPHEAALALERAFDLAARHRIDVTALDLDEETEKLVHEWFGVGSRLSFLKRLVLNIVVAFFNVAVCISRPRVVFVGTAGDVTIAWYVYEFLCQQGRRWLLLYERDEKAARRAITKNKRHSFVQGFIYGISSQLRQRQQQLIIEDSKTALVLAEQEKARSDYMDDVVPSRTMRKLTIGRELSGPLMAGFYRGQETKISTPLPETRRLALTG